IGYSLAIELTRRSSRAPRLVIGRDTRESGKWIEASLARGLRAARAGGRLPGGVPAPGRAFLTRAACPGAGGGISASHHSAEDNGIKVFSPSGRKLDDEAEREIERNLTGEWGVGSWELGMGDEEVIFPTPDSPLPTPHSDASLGDKYLAFLRDEVGAGLSLKG